MSKMIVKNNSEKTLNLFLVAVFLFILFSIVRQEKFRNIAKEALIRASLVTGGISFFILNCMKDALNEVEKKD